MPVTKVPESVIRPPIWTKCASFVLIRVETVPERVIESPIPTIEPERRPYERPEILKVRAEVSDDCAPGASTSEPPADPTTLALPATVTALASAPRAPSEVTNKVPLATVVVPVKLFAELVSSKTPPSLFVKPAVPATILAIVAESPYLTVKVGVVPPSVNVPVVMR